MSPPDLAGVMLWTSAERFQAMRDFYVETLGLPPRSDREGFVNFQWEGVRLTIGIHGEVAGRAADRRRVMVNFAVPDLAGFHEHLLAEGVVCVRPPEAEHWGLLATYEDPDGNTFQLMQLRG